MGTDPVKPLKTRLSRGLSPEIPTLRGGERHVVRRGALAETADFGKDASKPGNLETRVLGLAGDKRLGMELDARRRICVAFDGLDDSIWRTGGDAETRGESLDALVMVAVHGQRRAADRGREAGTAFYRHGMCRGIHRVLRPRPDAVAAYGDALRRHVLRRDVLDERSSEEDIYELVSAADPKYGEPAPHRARHKRKVEPVPLGVHVARGVSLRVSRRVNILASRHKQEVYARKSLVKPRFVRAMRNQHRNVSGLRKCIKVVRRRDVGRAAAVVTHSNDNRLRVRRQHTRRCREAERHDRADHIFHSEMRPYQDGATEVPRVCANLVNT